MVQISHFLPAIASHRALSGGGPSDPGSRVDSVEFVFGLLHDAV